MTNKQNPNGFKEFNLSYRIEEASHFSETAKVIHIKNVAEFIRLVKQELRKEFHLNYKNYCKEGQAWWIEYYINKLAGEKFK